MDDKSALRNLLESKRPGSSTRGKIWDLVQRTKDKKFEEIFLPLQELIDQSYDIPDWNDLSFDERKKVLRPLAQKMLSPDILAIFYFLIIEDHDRTRELFKLWVERFAPIYGDEQWWNDALPFINFSQTMNFSPKL
jgi:hypothetical protein